MALWKNVISTPPLSSFLMKCMTKEFLKLNSGFTVLIQIAGRGGGKDKSVALKVPKFGVLGWLVENSHKPTYCFHPCNIWAPGAALVLWIVSPLVCQCGWSRSWSAGSARGPGRMCITGLFVLRGWGGKEPYVWTLKHCRCHDVCQRPWNYTWPPGCLPLLLCWDCADRALPHVSCRK